jgi:D-glycero-beta-D-manno-heptose-7-phosphate kinase
MIDQLESLLLAIRNKRVLVVGDLMLDRFLWGSVSRISPEAPVPVVHVEREEHYPGGAANVARNLAPLGIQVSLAGTRGSDPNGALLAQLLSDLGVTTSAIVIDPSRPTITKTRVVARQQQVARIDREQAGPPSQALVDALLDSLDKEIKLADAVILEDYGKGLLCPPLIEGILAASNAANIPVLADPNPRSPLQWHGVTAVKPNRQEAFAAAGLPDLSPHAPAAEDPALHEVARRLMLAWDVPILLITLGEQGMLLLEREKEPFHLPTRAVEVFDVSGAGDTAIAFFTAAFVTCGNARTAAQLANLASGVVVGKLGTAWASPEEILAANHSAP